MTYHLYSRGCKHGRVTERPHAILHGRAVRTKMMPGHCNFFSGHILRAGAFILAGVGPCPVTILLPLRQLLASQRAAQA